MDLGFPIGISSELPKRAQCSASSSSSPSIDILFLVFIDVESVLCSFTPPFWFVLSAAAAEPPAVHKSDADEAGSKKVSWIAMGSYGTILEIQNIVVKCREWISDIKGSIRIERLLVKILNKFMVAPRYPEVVIGVTLRSLLDFLGLKSGVKRRRARALRSFTNFASWATLTVRDSLATEQLSLAPKKWTQSNQRLNQLNPSEAFQLQFRLSHAFGLLWTVGGCWNMLELQ